MIQENELLTFLLAAVVWVFFAFSWSSIKQLPRWRILLAAFVALTAGYIFTLLEGFFWPVALNLFEHIFCSLSSVLIAVWCLIFFSDSHEMPQ